MNPKIIEADGDLGEFLEGIGSGGSVQLSYPHLVLWWLNGNPQLEPRNGPRYYGGWAVDAGKMEDFAESIGVEIPSSFVRCTHWIGGGKTLDLYASRTVTIAPVKERVSFLLNDERVFKWEKGARKHVQLLAYMAENSEDGINPIGPVVLSVKGMNSSRLLNAFKAWGEYTKQARREIAPNVQTNYFWREVGTIGEEIEIEMVGQQGQQSPITPIKVALPETIEPYIHRRWVGNETCQTMNDLFLRSKIWLEDWSPNGSGLSEFYG